MRREKDGRPERPVISKHTLESILSRIYALEERVAQLEYQADRERQERAFRGL